jgi:CDP-diglyceride synthetase
MSNSPEALIAGMGMAVFVVILAVAMLISLAVLVFMIWCWWRILSRAGYAGPLALLMLVPFGGLILTCWMAFGNWPVLAELEALRAGAQLPPPGRA